MYFFLLKNSQFLCTTVAYFFTRVDPPHSFHAVVVAAAHGVEALCIEKNKLQPEPDKALKLGQSSSQEKELKTV